MRPTEHPSRLMRQNPTNAATVADLLQAFRNLQGAYRETEAQLADVDAAIAAVQDNLARVTERLDQARTRPA